MARGFAAATQLAAFARDGADPAERPRVGRPSRRALGGADRRSPRRQAATRRASDAAPKLARVERRDQVVGVPLGRVDRLLEIQPPVDVAQRGRAAPTAPAGRRRACRTRATARRRAGRAPATGSCAGACRARATTAGPPRARTSARATRAASRARGSSASSAASRRSASPRSRFPNRSATSRCTVSPARGLSRAGTCLAAADECGRRPRPGRSSPLASSPIERAALVGVLPREQPVERDVAESP